MKIDTNNANPSFTRRELQVADLISRGYSEKEIAGMIFVSPATVNNHTRNIRKKFHLNKNTEIILLYISVINGKTFSIDKIHESGVKCIL